MSAERGSFRTGILIGLTVTAVAIALLVFWASLARTSTGAWTYESPATAALLFIGVSQVVWMLPVNLFLLIKKKSQTMKGVLTVAAVLFALNALLLFSNFHRGRLYL